MMMSKEKKQKKIPKQLSTNDKLKMLMNNPKIWIENLVKIADKEGNVVPFKLNELQGDFVKNMEKFNIILKSRQLGFSSVALALSLYYANTQPNTTCLLMSYSIDSATGIFEKLKQMYFTIPEAFACKLENNNKKELKFKNGSRIIISTCGNKDVARGLTIKFAHLSEVAFMKETVEKQMLAIEQALVPNGYMILESTANGLNYFNELWNKANNGETMYKPFFYNWYQNKSMFAKDYEYSMMVWNKRENPIPTYENLTTEEQMLFDKGATIEQLIWRRLKINNANEEQFKQEYPSTPLEAFITTGNSVFDSTKIIERERYIDTPKTKSELKDIPKTLINHVGKSFFIWEKVNKNMKYYIGVDAAEGIGQDFSVASVIDEDGKQVAEFRSNKIPPYQFAELVYELGKYYNYGYLVIEKASAGHTVISKLRYDFKYMNMHKHKSYDARGRQKKKVGYETNSTSKPMMINHFRESFEEGQTLIQSPHVLDEMKVFVADDRGIMNALKGRHDDCIIAYCLALQGLKSGIWYL